MNDDIKLGIDLYEVLIKMNEAEINGCIHKLEEKAVSKTSKIELNNILNIVNK